jgi:coenzyme F420-0:L-glutamate ligase/coenzyme F420-1:gamma-L-glutamate ligase
MDHLSNVRSFTELVTSRRSIRQFTSDVIDEHTLCELIELARWAPSPHNAQPWRFTILRPTARERLAHAMAERLRVELAATGMPATTIERLTMRSVQRITSAPGALLCSLVRDGLALYQDERRDTLEFEMAVQSVGAVLQTLFLAAWEQGIGSCWMAAPMYCPDVVRSVLDLPADYEPQALALLGYPAAPGRVRERQPLERIVNVR